MSHFSEYKVHNQIHLYSLIPFLDKTGLEADLREFSLEFEQNHLRGVVLRLQFRELCAGSSRATADCREGKLHSRALQGEKS